MSYNGLLKQSCTVLRLTKTQVDGAVTEIWASLEDDVRCFLNLGYARPGQDPIWTPDNGTAQNRSGVLFLSKKSKARPSDRVRMIKGPPGTFIIEGSIDEVWTPRRFDHLECFVVEANRELT